MSNIILAKPTLTDPYGVNSENNYPKEIFRNQRFTIECPGEIKLPITKNNIFISYEDGGMETVWCNVAIDEINPKLIYIYPIKALDIGKRITLYLYNCDFIYNDKELHYENLYWHFIIGEVFGDYPSDPFVVHPISTSTSSVSSGNLEIIETIPEVGESNVDFDTIIQIKFNKDLDSSQDLTDKIKIVVHNVLY